MKKLLLAPFLLTSIFLFGGELKAHPDSRYELPGPKSSLPESQSKSKDIWYLLNQNAIREIKYGPSNFDAFEELMITSLNANESVCRRFASEEKRWIKGIDLGRWEDGKIRYVYFSKCIKGTKENAANYLLRIASIKMKISNKRGWRKRIDPDQIEYSSFNTLYFKDLSKCNLAKSKLDVWFTTLENKFRTNNRFKRFVQYSTKCFSKT